MKNFVRKIIKSFIVGIVLSGTLLASTEDKQYGQDNEVLLLIRSAYGCNLSVETIIKGYLYAGKA